MSTLRKPALLAFTVWVALHVAPAHGQTTITVAPVRLTPATPATAAVVQAAPGELPSNVFAGETGATTAQTAAETAAGRLQKIQQLNFDRRPSTILRAWSVPAEAFDAETATTPANAALNAARLRAAGVVSATGTSRATASATPDLFDAELKTFRRNVTLGDWPAVKAALARLPVDEGQALYKRLIESLPTPPQNSGAIMMGGDVVMMNGMGRVMPNMMAFAEKNSVSNADVIALAGAAPQALDTATMASLGQLARLSFEQGNAVEDLLVRLREGLRAADRAKEAGDKNARVFPFTRRESARLLMASGNAAEAGEFLPSPAQAEKDDDREALNLLARHYLSLHARDKKAEFLEKAWDVTQAALSAGKVDRKEKDEAIARAVDLAVKVKDELGKGWLAESFTKRPERGMEIIAAIGAASSKGIQTTPMDADARKKSLDLQKTAVEALLKAAPERASTWSKSLSLLADAWLNEAQFSQQYDTSTSLGPRMRRDAFGNFFYMNDDGMMMPNGMVNPNMPRAIKVADVLEARPGDAWTAFIEPAQRPKFADTVSRLFLKVGEDALAFPTIEALAKTYPDRAKNLAEEFVRVWTRNHDPNAERNRTNPYIYMFGFERKAESIPLTRSKQERNLKELSGWVKKLRALPIGGLDEALLAKAFTTCHSAAEVYRLEAIESVFGSLDGLKPETLAELVQQMRGNLATVWRQPAVQEQQKTNRKEKDIRAEVLRGYEVARTVVASAQKKYPDQWALELAGAAVAHDENAYRQEIEPSLSFTKARGEALARFRKAAALYAKKVGSIREDEETIQPFEQWFDAGLGACDLRAIDDKTLPDTRQPALIRDAILALPGPAAGRHMAKFANALFTRMSGLNPAVKFRYLKGGFEVVGDHKQAHEARKVYDYYKDLVTEITLETAVDGPADVGNGKPFGLFVNIRHTKEIERESGGFGRYLQNQNQGNMFFYNYGRPLENYRDKFQESTTKALQDQFQVLSVTFQDEKVNSKAGAEYGWRFTPYAYVLLKAKSPEVDKVAPLRLDLDFLDTSGYVIIPAESPVVPIKASSTRPPGRPFENLKLTQTLDERQAKDGKLIVEVKATARGLVPDLDTLVDINSPDFQVSRTEDQGVSVSRFDPESAATAVLSERSWLLTYAAVDGLPKAPTTFTFPKPKVEVAESVHQRYVDADLAQVPEVVNLDEKYGRPSRAWVGWTVGGLVALIGLVTAAWFFRPRKTTEVSDRFAMPEPLTPFTVLGLLRDIQAHDGLTDARKLELATTIRQLERQYFAESAAEATDLHEVASSWIRQSSRRN